MATRIRSADQMVGMPQSVRARGFGSTALTSTEVAPGVVVHLPQPSQKITLPGQPTSRPTEDGGAVVNLNPQPKQEPGAEKGAWRENLALKISDFELSTIAEELLQGIEADLRSRQEWEQSYTRGLDLLGVKLQEPSATPQQSNNIAGIATITNPALLEACIRFQAAAIGEMLPAAGPAKIAIDGAETDASKQMAEWFQQDFNHYLTTVDQDYYPDTTRGLFHVAFYGGVAKKFYWDPLLRRPVSRCVYLWDLILSQDAITINTAARVTHRSKMRTPTVRRLMKQGVWKTQGLSPPNPTIGSSPGDKEKMLLGITSVTERFADREHTIYECYCDLDLPGYENADKGEMTGITMPYAVTLDKDSKRVLALRRNWDEEDDNFTPRRPFVLFPFVLGLGFYPIGFLHILGNTTRTLTAIDREMVDAGMYANFPGGAISDEVARQETNELQSGPGAFKQIKTGGRDIREVLMSWPYKDVTPGLLALRTKIMEEAQRLGGSAMMPVGEGNPDIPVGTMLALIEQATKPEAAVHKLLHRAQAEELQGLRGLFAEDPKALWRWAKTPARQWRAAAEFTDMELVPVSDPNVPSHTHRIMQVTALVQLYTIFQAQMDPAEVLKRALTVLGLEDKDALFAKPGAGDAGGLAEMLKGKNSPAQDAAAIMKAGAAQTMAQVAASKAQAEQQDTQRKAATEAVETQLNTQKLGLETQSQQADLADRAADRATKERIAQMSEDTERIRLQIEESRANREQMQLAEEQQQSRQAEMQRHAIDTHVQQQQFGEDARQADQQHQATMAQHQDAHGLAQSEHHLAKRQFGEQVTARKAENKIAAKVAAKPAAKPKAKS